MNKLQQLIRDRNKTIKILNHSPPCLITVISLSLITPLVVIDVADSYHNGGFEKVTKVTVK